MEPSSPDRPQIEPGVCPPPLLSVVVPAPHPPPTHVYPLLHPHGTFFPSCNGVEGFGPMILGTSFRALSLRVKLTDMPTTNLSHRSTSLRTRAPRAMFEPSRSTVHVTAVYPTMICHCCVAACQKNCNFSPHRARSIRCSITSYENRTVRNHVTPRRSVPNHTTAAIPHTRLAPRRIYHRVHVPLRAASDLHVHHDRRSGAVHDPLNESNRGPYRLSIGLVHGDLHFVVLRKDVADSRPECTDARERGHV